MKVFCERCHGVFDEEQQSDLCPHKKHGDLVLAVRSDGKSAIVPEREVVKYIAAKDPHGSKAELRLVVTRDDGVVPDRIELQHGTVLHTNTEQKLVVHVPWLARVRAWFARLFRRNR